MDRIMALLADSSGNKMAKVDSDCRRQLKFWELAALACNGRLSIPNLEASLPLWAVDIFTDAAGGKLDSPGRGSGGVCGENWFYIPWSAHWQPWWCSLRSAGCGQ